MDVRSLGSYGAEVTGGYGSPRIGAGIEPKSSAKVNHGIVISPNLGKVPPGGGGGVVTVVSQLSMVPRIRTVATAFLPNAQPYMGENN